MQWHAGMRSTMVLSGSANACLAFSISVCGWLDFERTRAWLGLDQATACCSLHDIGRIYLQEGMGMGVRIDRLPTLMQATAPQLRQDICIAQRLAPTPRRRQRSPRLRKCNPLLSW
jgi:hypothetical protein